ncbi:PLP-dependent aminotransferase family protein, partial [Singulisphaera rosea]
AASSELGGLLEVIPSETGLQVMGWLPDHIDDRDAARKAAALGVVAPPLSSYTVEPIARNGLLLGYAAHSPTRIREGMRKLALALR